MSCLHISKETPTTNVYNALWLSVDKPKKKKKTNCQSEQWKYRNEISSKNEQTD